MEKFANQNKGAIFENNLKQTNMLNVIITKEEASKIGFHKVGLAGGKRNKETGKRDTIYFCSHIDFIKQFNREMEFIQV